MSPPTPIDDAVSNDASSKDDLPGEQSPEQALRQFGLSEFRPGQRQVIDALLAGHSAAAVFPTGGGKSLCYQLPALLLPGITLVVSPLIALMKDQIDALAAHGIAAERLDSTLSFDDYRAVMQRVRNGALRLLYVAPERFNNERFRETLTGLRVSLFAIDEAHCISEWGHNFRPDYLKLAEFARACGAERILALTATATPRVLADIQAVFDIAAEHAITTGAYRPNLALAFTSVKASERDQTLIDRLRERPAGAGIVYVTLQKTAEAVAATLRSADIDARAYHAGLPTERRTAIQDWFLASTNGIVVATIAFGMGVDKADIRYVYHYNLAKSLENYAQEIGRAGRDGKPSVCEALVCLDDLTLLQNFVYGDTPTRRSVSALMEQVFSPDAAVEHEFDVSYSELASATDIRLLVVRTLLTYLELGGYLQGGTPFYAGYRFKPLMSSKEMLTRVPDAERDFHKAMFQRARKARVWLDLDVDQTAFELGVPRSRIVGALEQLAEQALLELKSAGVRNRYRVLRRPEDLDELAAELYARMQQREQAELARVQEFLDLAGMDGCQVAALCGHFGEQRPAECGHCGWCETHARLTLPAAVPAPVEIDSAVRQQVASLVEAHPALQDIEVQARLLCGVTSPWLTAAKLTRHALYGSLAHVPFQAIRTALATDSD